MNLNTFLIRFGLDPDDFENKFVEPIKNDYGFTYYVEQKKGNYVCPHCGCYDKHHIKDYCNVSINESENMFIRDVLIIKKVRYKCNACHKSFTPTINGIARNSSTSDAVKFKIINEFKNIYSFQNIANIYDMSISYVINLFDTTYPNVPRKKLPKILCIDEIHFTRDLDQKYICVLYDWETKTLIDIIQNRQLSYLRAYFSNIPKDELNNVKYFISDLYDAYRTVHSNYFPNSIHVADKFHVIIQLTKAVNTLRTRTMNTIATPKSKEYNFMKSHWKLFLCRRDNIPNKIYKHKKSGCSKSYEDMVYLCIQLNPTLWEAYNALQDLYSYDQKDTFINTKSYIEYMSDRLQKCDSDDIKAVGRTYHKWAVEISNTFTAKKEQVNITNSVAEGINNTLKTLIKIAYGFKSFMRFRNRALLILQDKKLDKLSLKKTKN